MQPSVAIPSSLQADTAIFDEPVTPTTTVTLSAFSSRLTPRQSSLSGLFSKTGNSQKNILSQSLSTETTKPILKGVAWKRRGGMGKYSTTAWERRGISLEGTKLHYFRQEDVRAADNAQIDEDEAVLEDGLPSSGGNNKEQRGVVGGPNSWFETAGLNWSSSTSVESAEGSVIPRGTIDLAKDSATVHAAFGHSGAPSPFALSIKIRGETKWKLCFDRHSTQMQWLSAISDVVVQSSVDTYNASLLEAADPSNHVDFALFQPPINKDGPATREGPISGQANRLWLLERYRVTSRDYIEEDDDAMEANMLTEQTNVAVMSDKMTDTTVATDTIDIEIFEDKAPAMEFTELDHIAAQQVARVNAKHVWAIPQENIWRLLALVNLALFYARASSTSVAGFWHLVVFVNVGIHFCMSKLPSWENLLEFVQAVPRAPRMGKQKQIVKSETTAIATVHTSVSKVVVHSSTSAKTTLSYIPDAGSSTVHLKEPTEPPRNGKGEMFAGWCNVPGEILAVRSHGYKVSKQKVPSPGELYECVQVDIFESPQRYPDMATRVNLPKVTFQDDGPKTWRSPDIFIISIALPTDPPKMTKASSDGGGYTVTMYFRMKQATRDVLRRVTADDYDPSTETTDNIQKSTVNAVRLLEEWIRRAPTDHKFQSRFKVVPNAHNLKEIGMPSWIGSYNGKPFLIKRPGVTGFMFVHSELSCVELDVSLHPFPYLAKQGICFMKESYFKRVLVSFGFVIEGRTDDEVRKTRLMIYEAPHCIISLNAYSLFVLTNTSFLSVLLG